MGKKLLLIIIDMLLIGGFLFAQEDSIRNVIPTSIIDSSGRTIDNTEQNKTSKWDSFINKFRGQSNGVEIDSMQILKDSIIKLNETIVHLQQKKVPESIQNNQQSTISNLQRENNRLNDIITKQIISTFGGRMKASTANNFFCFSVMESPLFYNYDMQRVEQSLNIAKAMGYDTHGHEFNWIYNIYCDLLINYEKYNAELIENINAVIEQFSYGKPNREFERDRFEDRLAASHYYQIRGKGEYGTYRHIYYLDFQIEQVRVLFKSDANFNSSNFIKVLNTL